MLPTILVVRQADGNYQISVWTGADGCKPVIVAENLPPEQAGEVARNAFGLIERVQRMRQARLN
jgi:hypothetical protein